MRKTLLALALLGCGGAALATRAPYELPRETATFKPGPGAELANARCLACHSADYVATQPPMPLAFWKGEVEKMRDKYGAELPPEDVDALAAYLAQFYGMEKSSSQTPAAAAPVAHNPDEIAFHYGCFSCHDTQKRKVGPAFRDVAAKYHGKADGRVRIARQIRRGGGGQWGTKPMPPFPKIPKPYVEALTDWILQQNP